VAQGAIRMQSKSNRPLRIDSTNTTGYFRLLPQSSRLVSWLLLSLITVGLTGCATKKVEPDPRLDPPVVPVMTVSLASGALTSYTGIVKARVESMLGFRVPGKITERLVEAGQFVKRGQALFRLDRTDLAHAMNARKDSVLAQKGSVESKRSAVDAAHAHMVQAEADEKRYRDALAVGVVTSSSYDQYRAAAESARAMFVAAQADVKAAKEQASSLLAQEKVAENESSYSTLYSDVDGVITEVLAETGQVVSAGQPILKVARSGPREASIELPETVRPQLGSSAVATLYNSKVPPCKAHLRELSQSADKVTRTFEARYVLEGEAADSPLGATITVTPEISRRAEGIKLPLTALIDKGNGPNVWVVEPGSSAVKLQPVQIAVLGEENALLSSGPRAGDMVVVQGAHLLHIGDKVRAQISAGEFRPVVLKTPPHESK